jgi:hypothetical protein
MCVKALKGTALLGVELVLVLEELDPVVLVLAAKAFLGGVSTPEDGV